MPLARGSTFIDRIGSIPDGRFIFICQRAPHRRTEQMFATREGAERYRERHDDMAHGARWADCIDPAMVSDAMGRCTDWKALGRFTRYIMNPTNDRCWRWRFNLNQYGYGMFKIANRTQSAHRVSYQWSTADLVSGMQID